MKIRDESAHDSDDDVFERLRALTAAQQEPAAEAEPPRHEEPAVEPEPPAEPLRRTGRAEPAAQPATDEEESIEAYMARLLNRMRGGADEPSPAQTRAAQTRAAAEAAAPAPAPVVDEPVIAPIETILSTEEPLTLVPRATTGPACDMAAMRALANMSVHSALTTHRKNHRRRKVLGKWSLTGMAAVMSSVLSFQAIEGNELNWYATAIGWCLTVGCAAAAATMSRQLLRDNKPARPQPSEAAEPTPAQLIQPSNSAE